jgi:hypothetical protein
MKYVLYPVFAFWLIWLFWYLSGGPLRSEKSHPFISPVFSPTENTTFEYSDKLDFSDLEDLKNRIQNN